MPINTSQTDRVKVVYNLEQIFVHEYDDLKGSSVSEGHQVVDLLFAPALLLQCVTDDVGRPLEARIKMKGHVCPRLHAAPTGQVNLKPTRYITVYHCLDRLRTNFKCDFFSFFVMWLLAIMQFFIKPSLFLLLLKYLNHRLFFVPCP